MNQYPVQVPVFIPYESSGNETELSTFAIIAIVGLLVAVTIFLFATSDEF